MTGVRLGVVAAAGRGVRAWPRTERVPKVLLEVGGETLLARNVRALREELGVEEVIVLVGHLGSQVRAALGDGGEHGVSVRYVDVADPREGLAAELLRARELLREPFALVLGDELYVDADRSRLLPLTDAWEAACAYVVAPDPRLVAANYEVLVEGERVLDVVEKPSPPRTSNRGVGSFVLRPSILEAAERTPPNPRTGRVELIDALGTLVREGRAVRGVLLGGAYVNVNSVEDQNTASYLVRSHRFARTRVSVVIPAWNEEESIGHVVRDFLPHVHEVVVADNQSTDRTAAIARELGARVSSRPLAGYGEAIRHGMSVATGDLLVLVEADHSFRAKDLGKLLEYSKDADLVVGTRTTREMIEQGTNMRGVVRWANVIVGKLVEALWWSQEPRLTDVGCTYRAIWRDVYEKIAPRLGGVGPELAPEMVIEVLRQRRRVVEIPVSYYARVGGTSKHSGGYLALARTALRMLRTIFAKRFARG